MQAKQNKRSGMKRTALAVAVASTIPAMAPVAVYAQDPILEEVVVTGIRGSLKRAMDIKREASGVVDSISAEDVGKFPDLNVAESLQRAKTALVERIGTATDIDTILLKGHSGRAVTDYARKIGADCIIVGSHKPGLSDHFLGSTASRIVRHSPCSVHVLR